MVQAAALRVENRVLPAGPTVLDLVSNAAFFYGAQRALVLEDRPLWTQMSFQAVEENMYSAARHGLTAQLYWPGIGWIPPDELVLRKLLPMAHEGLRDQRPRRPDIHPPDDGLGTLCCRRPAYSRTRCVVGVAVRPNLDQAGAPIVAHSSCACSTSAQVARADVAYSVPPGLTVCPVH